MKRPLLMALATSLLVIPALRAGTVYVPVTKDEIQGKLYKTKIWVTNSSDIPRRFTTLFLAADSDGSNHYVVWRARGSARIYGSRYTEGVGFAVPETLFAEVADDGWLDVPDVAVFDDQVWVVYNDQTNNGLVARHFNGAAWVDIPLFASVGTSINAPTIDVRANGSPVVGFSNGTGSRDIWVTWWTGSAFAPATSARGPDRPRPEGAARGVRLRSTPSLATVLSRPALSRGIRHARRRRAPGAPPVVNPGGGAETLADAYAALPRVLSTGSARPARRGRTQLGARRRALHANPSRATLLRGPRAPPGTRGAPGDLPRGPAQQARAGRSRR